MNDNFEFVYSEDIIFGAPMQISKGYPMHNSELTSHLNCALGKPCYFIHGVQYTSLVGGAPGRHHRAGRGAAAATAVAAAVCCSMIIYIYIYTNVYMYIYIYMYIHIYRYI